MTIKSHNRILLTGAAGGLGKVLRQRLKDNCHHLRSSDLTEFGPAFSWEEIVTVDLSDDLAMNDLLKDVDAVVHMGGISIDGPFLPILKSNILGAYNLYESARKNGVKRIVFASSNHVTGFYKQSETITANDPPRPDSHYGVSKAFGEDLSRFYFDRFQIETACIRIGSSFEEPKDRRMLASWLSFDDLHSLITACLTTPVLGHSIVFGVSNNKVTWYDNATAKHVGYSPKDSTDSFKESIYQKTSAPDLSNPAHIFQGGAFVSAGPFGLK
jgi:uronate dehydrogenase